MVVTLPSERVEFSIQFIIAFHNVTKADAEDLFAEKWFVDDPYLLFLGLVRRL